MKHASLLLLLALFCTASASARQAARTSSPPHRLSIWEKIALKTAEKRLRKIAAISFAQADSTRPCGYVVVYPGERVEAELLEMSSSTVTYRPCGAPETTRIVRSKTQIIAVVAPNGDELYSHLKGPFSAPSISSIDSEIKKRDEPHIDGLAFVSVILSLVPFSLIAPILAIISGAMSLSRIHKNPRKYRGKTLAIIGTVLGVLGLLLLVLL